MPETEAGKVHRKESSCWLIDSTDGKLMMSFFMFFFSLFKRLPGWFGCLLDGLGDLPKVSLSV